MFGFLIALVGQAALPALRTLARAYSQLGEYPSAESMYKQAASLQGNYNADVDYHELGDLFQHRAESAQTDENRVRFQRAALENWARATQEPGIDPVSKSEIQKKYDWLIQELPEGMAEGILPGEAASSAPETDPPAPTGEVPAKTEPTPQASSRLETEPDPAVEAAHMARTRPVSTG